MLAYPPLNGVGIQITSYRIILSELPTGVIIKITLDIRRVSSPLHRELSMPLERPFIATLLGVGEALGKLMLNGFV